MMQYPGNAVALQPYQRFTCLKASIITIGIIGLMFWITCLGLSAGLCFEPYGQATTRFIGFLLVVVHTAYIFFTSEIIFSVSYGDNFSNGDLRKLRSTTSRLLAATMTGVGVSVSIIIHVIRFGLGDEWRFEWYDAEGRTNYYYQYNAESVTCAFGVSFSYIWTCILVILTAVYYKKCHRNMKNEGLPGHPQLPVTVYPVATTETPQQMEMIRRPQQMEMIRRPQQMEMIRTPQQMEMIRTPQQMEMIETHQQMATPPPRNPQGPTVQSRASQSHRAPWGPEPRHFASKVGMKLLKRGASSAFEGLSSAFEDQ